MGRNETRQSEGEKRWKGEALLVKCPLPTRPVFPHVCEWHTQTCRSIHRWVDLLSLQSTASFLYLKTWAFIPNMEMKWDQLLFFGDHWKRSWLSVEACWHPGWRCQEQWPQRSAARHRLHSCKRRDEEGIVYLRETGHFLSNSLLCREWVSLWNPSYSSGTLQYWPRGEW